MKIGEITPTSTSFQYYLTGTFPVTAGTHQVTFRGMNPGGDRTSFIDRVSIVKSSSLVLVSLSADIGKMNLGSANGITFYQGSATDCASMVIIGTLGDVNAALNGSAICAAGRL